MILRFTALLLALSLSACSSVSQHDLTDLGEIEELAARAAFNAGAKEKATSGYLTAEKYYFDALQEAISNVDILWTSFLRLKVAICRERVGILYRPADGEQSGHWVTAAKCFAAAAAIAADGGFLQMQANCLIQQAGCTRPDFNPNGSWSVAEALYERAADLCKEVFGRVKKMDKQHLGEALCGQAVSMLRGGDIKAAPDEVLRLLSEARAYGNVQAARLLTQSDVDFCHVCGCKTESSYQFCDKCGAKKSGDN